ncbi:hypothetical protein GUITHDRAFT_104600 [Guillardia theta CCMP2712]|uniref:GDP-fucose protein O-fucosyltransferase 2 n=1 Tax=Guillardia theta (strain CCMP2712) TaxID=905079 RepID=L1JMY0_GUITC|nr:hypothetical protein GUITHDRAFT_104600 [Guillardia theta CCMP2712]EKX49639.1 hypothetical protein GUITHDRAFT_104600 [Guillardia theta CCMP2712]|eukprot:XP_005836619.1 hypothetical protein GUITHDRAFT_104600 [Guillardia theta CCMP2712]
MKERECSRIILCLVFLSILVASSQEGQRHQQELEGRYSNRLELAVRCLEHGIQLLRSEHHQQAQGYMQTSYRMSQDVGTANASSISNKLRFAYINVRMQSAMYLGMLSEVTKSDHIARNYYMSALRLAKEHNSVPTFFHVCRHVENLRALVERKANKDHQSTEGFSSERFLVFRFWAGLSNRRQELIGMIGAARLLNRTLVLPDMVEGRWMANHKANRVVPKLPPVNTELHVRDYAYSGQFSSFGLSYGTISYVSPDQIQSPRPPQQLEQDLGRSKLPVLAIDFSYRLLDLGNAGEFEFFNGTAEWTPRRIDVKFTPSDFYVEILQHLHFSQQIASAGRAVMLATNMRESSFLAVHLRRNDMSYWKNRQHAWPETDQVQTLARSRNLSEIFLATDADGKEISRIQRSIPQLVLFDLGLRKRMGITTGEAQVAIVDQFVCSRAASFLGNFWSTFSWAIIEVVEARPRSDLLTVEQERHKLGHDSSSSHFFQVRLVEVVETGAQ